MKAVRNMNASTASENSLMTQSESFLLLPLIETQDGFKPVCSPVFDTEGIIQVLTKKALTKENLLHQTPIIDCELPSTTPGEIVFTILIRAVKQHDVAQFFSEMITNWLQPGKQTHILRSKFFHFAYAHSPEEVFFFGEIITFSEEESALYLIKKHISSFSQEIALGTTSAHNARHILATKGMTLDQKTAHLHKMIVHLSQGRLKPIAAELFTEMQYSLLASDDEFKRIRDLKHLIRIICYCSWFRKSLRSSKKEITDQRKAIFKCVRSDLHFAFGKKKVIGIIIAINFIKEYERFDEKHILKACQKIIPNICVVPHSFFTYENSSDSVRAFYIEIEKKDGKAISHEELKNLSSSLEEELITCIEQLSHRLFMPHNEEEVMRNILLLNRELRFVRDIPQMTISFQSQSENTITFLIILVRILKTQQDPPLEILFRHQHEVVRFIPRSKKIVGKLRNKYPKEANTFLLECQKAPFLRQDHSVDLSRARQFVGSIIGTALGEVRDFNGGLICQQNQLLNSLKALLTPQELKHELHLENLFHSITPIVMQSLLSPDLFKTLFQLFLKLHFESHSKAGIEWKEHINENALSVMTRLSDCVSCARIETAIEDLHLKELELASTSFKIDGIRYRGYIVLSEDPEKLQHFLELLREQVNTNEKTTQKQTLKISLPRPTSLLDPRIGTDRTSGIVIKMLYESLMRIDPSGKCTPAAAENVTISDDKKCYTFHLRHTRWSNGKPVQAHDFEYAWKKILDPGFKSLFAYLFYPIKNAQAVKKGKLGIDDVGITSIDDYTLQVELEYPAPFFLELTSHWAYSPLCKEIDEIHPGWAYYGGDTYVCNGPFKLAKWKRNTEIRAVKNNEYWDRRSVHLDQIDISIIENAKTALSMYEKGELDWIGEPLSEIPPEAFQKNSLHEKIHSHSISAIHWYGCNVQALPLSTKKLRRALAMAVDRKAIIQELLQEGEAAAFSILPPNLSLAREQFFPDGNKEEAKRLFYEGLEEIGQSIANIPQLTVTTSDQELHRSIAYSIAKQWKELLGIDLRVETFTWSRYMEKCLQHDFQLMATTWYSWYNDPIYNLEQVKYSTSDMNMTQWQNDDYTALLNRAESCLDMNEREILLHAAEKIVMEEMPIIPLFCYTFRYMKKQHVENIFLSHLGQIDFKWASIRKEAKQTKT